MSWNHGYALDEYQTRKINGGDHGITWRDIYIYSFTEMLLGVANAMVCLFFLPL